MDPFRQRPSSSVQESNFLSEAAAVVGSNANCNEKTSQGNAAIPLPSTVKDYAFATTNALLGRGAFSNVYRAEHRVSKRQVAIKTMKVIPTTLESYNWEYKINRVLRAHPNVVTLLDHSAPNDNLAHLIFELCSRGEVFQMIRPNVGLAPKEHIGAYFAQLVEAVHHVHECGICHLDIKPENLFVTENGKVKLGDFGLSALLEDGPVLGRRGSVSYASPENLRSKAKEALVHDEYGCRPRQGYDGQRADVWSIGVTLFVFLYGYTPWEAAHDSCYEYRIFKAKDGLPNVPPWNRMPTVFRTLFHRTISIRPSRRWNTTMLKEYINRDLGWHAR
eukprot:m.45502 g.45502  ORF g.45502 m.45502 type:complete len:333 (-) comp19987_c1_seq2:56-1054(-)